MIYTAPTSFREKSIHNSICPNSSDGSEIKSEVYLMDCVEGMKYYPDKYFDLAVVDPPYGIGKWSSGGGANTLKKSQEKKIKDWDSETPTDEYWQELFRVSTHQIVWGGNYFLDKLGNCYHVIIWDKKNRGMHLADGEMAWTSMRGTAIRIFDKHLSGTDAKGVTRVHPTQKPVVLYDWILSKYATPGQKILDTHLGSGSSRIAADKYKVNFVGFEIDAEYFSDSCARFDTHKSQIQMF